MYIPVVPALLITLVYVISMGLCEDSDFCVFELIDKNAWLIMWGNICLIFLSVWIYIRFILLKWKEIPEE